MSVTKITIKSATLENDDDLAEWGLFFEVDAVFQTRDRIGVVAGGNVTVPVGDHPPPHAHWFKDGVEVVVDLIDLTIKRVRGKLKEDDRRRLLKGIRRRADYLRDQQEKVMSRHS